MYPTQLLDLAWDRMWFPNQELLLDSSSFLLDQLGLTDQAWRTLDRRLVEVKPVTVLKDADDLEMLGTSLILAASLYRAGRTSEAEGYLEACEQAIAQYEAHHPDRLLGAAQFYRAQALLAMGRAQNALTAAQDAVMEFERWGHENPGPMPLGAAWADCLFGYCLSHPDSGERGVREHKSLAYCAKGVLELADWVGRNGAREPMLLWALELLAETLANLGEPETAYLLRLEMHHKRIADVARVQALFNLAVALNHQKLSALARSMGLREVEAQEDAAAQAILEKVRNADVAAKTVNPMSVGRLIQRHFNAPLEEVFSRLRADE